MTAGRDRRFQPLFGEGLGLDSIDVLELVLEIERHLASRLPMRDRDAGVAVGGHDCRLHRGRPQGEPGLIAANPPGDGRSLTVDIEEWFHHLRR